MILQTSQRRINNPKTTKPLDPFADDIEPKLIDLIKEKLPFKFRHSHFNTETEIFSAQEALRRGWATVYWSGYGEILSTLEKNLRYVTYSADPYSESIIRRGRNVRISVPIWDAFDEALNAEGGSFRPALQKDFPEVDSKSAKNIRDYIESLRPLLAEGRKYHYPVFAVGYNWLQSNNESAKYVYEQIDKIIKYVEKEPVYSKELSKKSSIPMKDSGGLGWKCDDGVIIVTHSMGGLVARALSKNHSDLKILGISHGVQPCDGAATLYARMKGGWEGVAGKFLADIGDELMPVLTQSPGAMELSPNQNYGADWLRIYDRSRKDIIDSFPKKPDQGKPDPYDDIYLQKSPWWKLGEPALMSPEADTPEEFEKAWKKYADVIEIAKNFHSDLDDHFHPTTYMHYGSSSKYTTWGAVTWEVGYYTESISVSQMTGEPMESLNKFPLLTFGWV